MATHDLMCYGKQPYRTLFFCHISQSFVIITRLETYNIRSEFDLRSVSKIKYLKYLNLNLNSKILDPSKSNSYILILRSEYLDPCFKNILNF